MCKLEKLPEEAIVAILNIVQQDELELYKSKRYHGYGQGCVVSPSIMRARLVCKQLRCCVDIAGIDVVVTKTKHMASLLSRISSKIPYVTGPIRPFGFPRMRFIYISNHTACLDSLWGSNGNECLTHFSELRIHQRVFLCPSFLSHYGESFWAKTIRFSAAEVTPKGVLYPFEGNSLFPGFSPPAGSRSSEAHRGIHFTSHSLKRSHGKSWGQSLYGKHQTIFIDSLVYLVGRTRTWAYGQDNRDVFPSHILRAGRYFVSEGPHSKKDSPCFLTGPFSIIKPSVELGANFVAVGDIREVHLCYIDVGCVKTFLAYFSGLRRVILGERVLGRANVQKAIAESGKAVRVVNNFRHV